MPKKLPEGEGKRVPLNMRTTREIRDRLEQAAEQSGRSLAQEVEERLGQSFIQNDLISAMSGGERLATLLTMISIVLKTTKDEDGKLWNEDPVVANIVGEALHKVVLASNGSIEAQELYHERPEIKDKVTWASTLIANHAVFFLHSKWGEEKRERYEDLHYKPDKIFEEMKTLLTK